MGKLAFFIPSLFLKYTRVRGRNSVIAYFLKHIMMMLLAALIHYETFDVIRFLVGVFFLYSLYEFGYIQNDAETIKKETNPTKRLTDSDLLFYESHKSAIYVVRVLWVICLSAILYALTVPISFLLYSYLIIPVFYIYNIVRSKWNLHIHVLLMFLRISVPVFIGSLYVDFPLCIWILFIYPIAVFVQLSVKGKFGYRNELFVKFLMPSYSKRDIHLFRVKYYTVFLLMVSMLSFCNLIIYWYLLPTVYYTMFTMASAKKYI